MDRYAIINQQGPVVNVILWDGIQPYLPPQDHILVFSPICDIGDTYDLQQKVFIKPDRTGADFIPE